MAYASTDMMGKDAGKGNEPKTVYQRAAAGDAGREPKAQRRDDGHGDRRGGDAPAVIRQGHDDPGGPEGLHDHDGIGGDDEPRQRRARDDAEATERDAHGNAEGHGKPQAPGADSAAGDLLRLQGYGDERGLGDGGREADGRAKGVNERVVVPHDDTGRTPSADDAGRGQLARHGLTDGEEGPLQPDEKQREPQKHEDGPDSDAAQVGQLSAQDGDLKQDKDYDDGRHVEGGGEEGAGEGVQEREHQTTKP